MLNEPDAQKWLHVQPGNFLMADPHTQDTHQNQGSRQNKQMAHLYQTEADLEELRRERVGFLHDTMSGITARELQKELIKYYLGPQMGKNSAEDTLQDVDNIYATLNLHQVEPYFGARVRDVPVRSLDDIFFKDDQECKKIYIHGDAGAGKTTLCKRIVHTWCQAIIKGNEDKELTEDEEMMERFGFVFYISLKHAADDIHVLEMIKHQLVNPKFHSIVQHIVEQESEQCLIILDGLDEWTPKEPVPPSPYYNRFLPQVPMCSKWTNITTTRPWKIDVVGLKSSALDQQIEMYPLTVTAANQVIQSVTDHLNKTYRRDKLAESFQTEMSQKHLYGLTTVPFLMRRLLSVWHDGMPIGNSLCDIYSNLIDLLLQLGNTQIMKIEGIETLMTEMAATSLHLPKCFEAKTKCQAFGPLLVSVAKVAFETMFSEKTERQMVFECPDPTIHGLTKKQLEVCLKAGILSETRWTRQCAVREKILSFIHKTFHEFFAAVFIAMKGENDDKCLEQVFTAVHSLKNVFELNKVMMFVSGMNPVWARKMSVRIRDFVSTCDGVTYYRRCTFKHQPMRHMSVSPIRDLMLLQVQELLLQCMVEGINNGHNNTLIVDDIDVASWKHCDHLEKMLYTNCNNVRSLVISKETPPDLREMIFKMFGSNKIHFKMLQKLVIEDISSADMEALSKVMEQSSSTLVALMLSGNAHTVDAMSSCRLLTLMQNMKNVESLSLAGFQIGDRELEKLAEFISRDESLRELQLSVSQCTDIEGAIGSRLDFSDCRRLEKLSLQCASTDIAPGLSGDCTEKYTVGSYPPAGFLSSALSSIPDGSQLTEFSCCIGHSEDVASLIALIPTMVNLEQLYLCNTNFGSQHLRLSSMKCLQEVIFSNVVMTIEAYCGFVSSLPNTGGMLTASLFWQMAESIDIAVAVLNYANTQARFIVEGNVTEKFSFVRMRYEARQ